MKRAVMALMVTRAVGSGLSAVTFLLFARNAGVEEVGIVGFITSATAFVAIVADSGLASLIAKSRAQGDAQLTSGGLALNAMLCTAFGATSAAAVLGWSALSEHNNLLALIACATALEASTETCLSVPIADGSRLVPAVSILLRRAATLVAFLAFTHVFMSPTSGYCAAICLGAVLGQFHIRQVVRAATAKKRRRVSARRVYRASLPYLASNVAAATRSLDITIVATFTGATPAGLYTTASRIVNPFQLAANSVTAIVMPRASRVAPDAARLLAHRLVFAFSILTCVFAAISFPAMLVVDAVAGRGFAGVSDVLAVLMIGSPVIIVTSPLGAVLQAQEQQRFVALNGAVFALLTVLLVAVGATGYSAVGGAVGLVVSYLLKAASLTYACEQRLSCADPAKQHSASDM